MAFHAGLQAEGVACHPLLALLAAAPIPGLCLTQGVAFAGAVLPTLSAVLPAIGGRYVRVE